MKTTDFAGKCWIARVLPESFQDDPDLCFIAAAKKVNMNQQRVQVKNVGSFFPSFFQWKAVLIMIIERRGESPEKSGHCEVDLSMAVID